MKSIKFENLKLIQVPLKKLTCHQLKRKIQRKKSVKNIMF